jgi:hypothetical protein
MLNYLQHTIFDSPASMALSELQRAPTMPAEQETQTTGSRLQVCFLLPLYVIGCLRIIFIASGYGAGLQFVSKLGEDQQAWTFACKCW